jgi:hypothetical protein
MDDGATARTCCESQEPLEAITARRNRGGAIRGERDIDLIVLAVAKREAQSLIQGPIRPEGINGKRRDSGIRVDEVHRVHDVECVSDVPQIVSATNLPVDAFCTGYDGCMEPRDSTPGDSACACRFEDYFRAEA